MPLLRFRQLSNSVYNDIKKFSIKDGRRRAGRIKDKVEKSTAEQAVDPQTKLILFKMINNGILENVNGVISTGKEAVILHAEGGPGPEPDQAVHSKGGHLDKEVEPMLNVLVLKTLEQARMEVLEEEELKIMKA